MVTLARSEPGCRFYDLFTAEADSTDCYGDGPALEACRAPAHCKACRARLPDLLAKPIG
jgi:quinol monooxygenase YgiN